MVFALGSTPPREESRGRLGTPTSGRHRPPDAGGTAYCRLAGWSGRPGNADLRSAPPARGGRTTYCRLAGCPAPATAAPVEVPVAGRTIPLFEVRLARRATARLCRPPPGELARGRRSLYLSQRPRGRFQTASQQWPIRREYRGVPSALPARRRADRTPIPTFPTPPSAPRADKIPGPAAWAMGGT